MVHQWSYMQIKLVEKLLKYYFSTYETVDDAVERCIATHSIKLDTACCRSESKKNNYIIEGAKNLLPCLAA